MRARAARCGYELRSPEWFPDMPGAHLVRGVWFAPGSGIQRVIRATGLKPLPGHAASTAGTVELACGICGHLPVEPVPGGCTMRCDPEKHAAYYDAFQG